MRALGALVVGALATLAGAARADAPRALVVAATQSGEERAFASLSRTLPAELGAVPEADEDALHFLLISPPDATLESLTALSLSAARRPVDVLVNLSAEPATCPEGVPPELVCRRTPELRLVADELERRHPALERRSLRVELGGALRLSSGGRTLLELPVTGPTGASSLEARLRAFVLREHPGGAPAVGGTDDGARRLVERELSTASAVWAQCGVELGKPPRTRVEVAQPPQGQLLVVGCDAGLPASGGSVSVQRGPQRLEVRTRPGEHPLSVAWRLADALGAGTRPAVFENQRSLGEAVPTADVWVRGGGVRAVSGAASSDPTLPVCITELDLSDGLAHFTDGDAFVGTPEERALLRAFDDADPTTVELFVVPRFDTSERIGESFIVTPGASLSSAVVLDRSAFAAGARSFALAHELGHVFLAMPGHPDDFGVDKSWSLMDADVSEPTIFGPRRLSRAECARAVTQAGPRALVPVLNAAR